MLAKQTWRLITEPESLRAQVLQVKYYPHGDILKAGPKAGSSFTWQSIFAGVATFKRGYVWRVGNGEKINIWQDPWIPSSPDRKIITPRGASIYTKVSDLIDPVSERWYEEVLRSLLSPVDVRILQIPLHNKGFEDFVAWGFTKHGRCTVRSGYHLQWRHQFGASAGQLALPGSSALNPVWKAMWQLKIPSKIKKIIWRTLHGRSFLSNVFWLIDMLVHRANALYAMMDRKIYCICCSVAWQRRNCGHRSEYMKS
jgi:hypothetical protein